MPQLYKKDETYIRPSDMDKAVLDGLITATERDNDYTLGNFDFPDPLPTPSNTEGFLNLHTNNSQNNAGDGKWYPLTSNKVQHTGDPSMSMLDALIAGYEIGE